MRNAKLQRLRPGPTLIDRAYESILAAICDRRLSPNQRINQEELADELHISRQPVGQALSVLKSQGFVRDNGRRGLVIAPLERELIRSIYQLREPIDSLAAGLASQRCAPADLDAGRKLLADGRRAVETGSVEELVAADMRFHMWIYTSSGNPLLVETMNHYWNHLRRAMGETLQHRPGRHAIWIEHEAILRAIIGRDDAAARSLATDHARNAGLGLLQALPAITAEPALPRPGKAGERGGAPRLELAPRTGLAGSRPAPSRRQGRKTSSQEPAHGPSRPVR